MSSGVKNESEESDREGDFGVREWRETGGNKSGVGREVRRRKKEDNTGKVVR